MLTFMNLPKKIKDYLLPHPEGLHRAKLIKHSTLAYYIGFFVSLSIFLNIFPKFGKNVFGFTSYITKDEIINVTNSERSNASLGTLTEDARLSAAAYKKAEDMFANNYWAHTSPQGKTPWDFILSVGYDYIYAGENLAKDFVYAEDAMKAWMNSPTHKANIVNPNYKNIGVAVVKGNMNDEEIVLVVQMFGTEPPVASGSLSGNQNTPTQALEILPTPEIGGASLETVKQVISEVKPSNSLLVNKFSLSKDLTAIIISIIMLALVADSIYMHRKRLTRLAGHNVAHLLIIGTALLGILSTGSGSIL